MANPTTASALNLLTDRARQFITIDGVAYTLRDGDDLSLSENKTFIELGARMEMLEALRQPTKAQDAEYDALVTRLCKVALIEVPDDVLARVPKAGRVALLETFIELSASGLLRMRARTPEAPPAPGTNSSPASSASTAGARPRGPKARRSGRSART